jgi:hypothetical protein
MFINNIDEIILLLRRKKDNVIEFNINSIKLTIPG